MDWKNFCIKCLIWVSRIFLKTCGVALFFFFFGLAGFITLSFKNNVMDYYSEQGHYLIVIVTKALILLTFLVLHNHLCHSCHKCLFQLPYSHVFLAWKNKRS